MDEYVKRIKFEAVKDSNSFKSLSNSMDQLSFKWSDNVKQEIKRVEQLQYEIKELSQQFEAIEDLKGEEFDELRKSLLEEKESREEELSLFTGRKSEEDEETKREKKKLEGKEKLKDSFTSALKSIGAAFLNSMKNLFSDAWSELKEITDFSRLSSSKTRELAFTYGFNSSQAYGYSQAMSMMGFQSEEDLMYATNKEIEQFKELFQKYTNWYEELGEEELELYRQYEIEMAEFKKDLKLAVVDFFMENKEEIKDLMEFMFDVGRVLVSSLGWLVKYFGGESLRDSSERALDAAEIISNYSTTNSSTVNNSTVNKNNFNNVFNIQGDTAATKNNVMEQLMIAVQKGIGGL